METINTQVFLAYCEYKAWGPSDLMPYFHFRAGMLYHYDLIHLWLSQGLSR